MTALSADDRWWVRSGKRSEAAMRLVCFPFAGGAASLYGGWEAALPASVEVVALQMPGRENRLREPPLRKMQAAVAQWIETFRDDRPFCVFGYSLGGLLAFETIRALRRAGRPLPQRLFVAASSAPHCEHARKPPVHRMNDEQFYDELRRFQGTPEAILQNAELMALLMPTLRADFELLETYRPSVEPPLPVPISAYGGLSDAQVAPDAVAQWSEHTSAGFSLQFLPGDHFFIKSAQERLLGHVTRELEAELRRLPPSGVVS